MTRLATTRRPAILIALLVTLGAAAEWCEQAASSGPYEGLAGLWEGTVRIGIAACKLEPAWKRQDLHGEARHTWEIDEEGRFTATMERMLPDIPSLKITGRLDKDLNITATQEFQEKCGDVVEHRVVRYRGHIDRTKKDLSCP